MAQCFDPRFEVLQAPQRELWDELRPAPRCGLVLYGGTAIALHLGHRHSVDFDFFGAEPLDKARIRQALPFAASAEVVQDAPNTLVVLAPMPAGLVKVSFFGGLSLGRVNDPLQTRDGTLLVASLDDLLATKLKAILDARDYRDIAELLRAGVSLPRGLAAFNAMFREGQVAEVLRAIGYFGDGDLASVSAEDRATLTGARDQVRDLPSIDLVTGSLAVELWTGEDPA